MGHPTPTLCEGNTADATHAFFFSRRPLPRGGCPSLVHFVCWAPGVTEQGQPVAAGRPWVHSWLVTGLQHLCYTDLLVAYSRWQLRTWGLAVWSTLLQTVKMLPALFVGDCVQNSGTCTLCSPFPTFAMPLPSRRKPLCLVCFQCSCWRGQGAAQTHIHNSLSLHLVFLFLGQNKSHLSWKHRAASHLQISSLYPKIQQCKELQKNVKTLHLSSSNISYDEHLNRKET